MAACGVAATLMVGSASSAVDSAPPTSEPRFEAAVTPIGESLAERDARRVVAAGLPGADLGPAADHDELLGIRRPGPHRRAGRSRRRRRRHRRRLRDAVRRGISDPADGADRALRRRRRGVDGRRQHVRVQLPSDHRRRRVLGPLVGQGGRHQSRREPVRQGRPRAAGGWPAVPRPHQLPSRGDRRRATWSSRPSRRSGSSGEATGRG